MGWSFRKRLQLIVAMTALTLVTLVVTDWLSLRIVERELAAIESDYVPLLDLGPAIQNGFSALAHGLQEAVAAQDREAHAATKLQKDELLARLDRAPPVVDRAALAELHGAIEDWYEAASGVSQRLINGETGEAIVSAMEDMQARQRRVLLLIQRTVILDRTRLSVAFHEARRVALLAAWFRIVLPVALTTVVTVLALGITSRLVRATAQLEEGFARFGRGDFSEPIEITGNDELSSASRNANRMARSLQEAGVQLQQRQQDLERANKELESFSYSVSHDLRAPLRSVDGFSQILLEEFADQLPAEGQEHLRRVRGAAQRMAQLIDDILRLSRINRGELHRAPVDLSELARRVGGELALANPASSVELVVQDRLSVGGDAQLLRIALENLLGNAWKFTSRVEHPRVEVGQLPNREIPTYFVRDNGAGFDPVYAARLFIPFQRLHAASEFPGTGIGLATVQRIVHRHGGRVWAEGVVGRGATFFFTIPDNTEGVSLPPRPGPAPEGVTA
jgi:signal transduction histidine kinase